MSIELPKKVSHETAVFMQWPIIPAPGSHFTILSPDDVAAMEASGEWAAAEVEWPLSE